MDFPDVVTVYPFVSKNASHDVSYGTARTQKCKYTELTEVTQEGDNTVISAWVAFPPRTVLSAEDKIVLGDGSQPAIASIQRIKSAVDNREVYVRVILGKPEARADL